MCIRDREAQSAESMMAPISENLIILKDGAGDVYWPFLTVNSLDYNTDDNVVDGLMGPGKGYQIKVYDDQLFSYPESSSEGRFALDVSPVYPVTKFAQSKNTGSNMTIGIPVEAWENIPNEGDEIAAYSQNGVLVGSVTYNGEATAITVWGDDITTDEVEGLLEGEEISFELWRKSEDKIEELTVHNWIEIMCIVLMALQLLVIFHQWLQEWAMSCIQMFQIHLIQALRLVSLLQRMEKLT